MEFLNRQTKILIIIYNISGFVQEYWKNTVLKKPLL
jgi:hypothetical protein